MVVVLGGDTSYITHRSLLSFLFSMLLSRSFSVIGVITLSPLIPKGGGWVMSCWTSVVVPKPFTLNPEP